MARTTYTFDGVTFERLVNGEFADWLTEGVAYTKYQILDSADSYLHVGATTREPLTIRARCASSADRESLVAKARTATTATLSNSRGRSGSFTLIKAARIDRGTGAYEVELTLEPR